MNHHIIPIDHDDDDQDMSSRRALPLPMVVEDEACVDFARFASLTVSVPQQQQQSTTDICTEVSRSLKAIRVSPELFNQRKRPKIVAVKRVSFCKQVKVNRIPRVSTEHRSECCDSQKKYREAARIDAAALRQKEQEQNNTTMSYFHQFERILEVMSNPPPGGAKDEEQNQILSGLLRSTQSDAEARGLEASLFPHFKKMRRHISRTILRAQSRLPSHISADEKAILLREVSLRLTKPLRHLARWMGARDANGVMDIVLESRG